jgi:hypothetical protein
LFKLDPAAEAQLKPGALRVNLKFCIQLMRHHQNLRRSTWPKASKRQSGVQETQKREDQDNCRSAKPKDRRMAADLRVWQKEIVTQWLTSASDELLG